MSPPYLTANRQAARTLGLLLFAAGVVLLIDGYRDQDAPWPLRLVHPLL